MQSQRGIYLRRVAYVRQYSKTISNCIEAISSASSIAIQNKRVFQHKSRKQDENFRTGHVKHNRSFSESSSDNFSKPFVPGKSKQYPNKGTSLSRSVLNSPGFLNQSARLRSHDSAVTDSLSSCDSRPGSSDESIANHSPVPQLDIGSPDNFGYFQMFDETGVCGSSLFTASGRGEAFEDFNRNFLKIDLSDVNDNYSERLSPMSARSPSVHADALNIPLIPLITKELEIESDIYFGQPVCEQSAISSPGVQKDASSVPLIRAELEKEEYGQQSSMRVHSPSAQSDAIGVSLLPSTKELEMTKEMSGYSGQQSPACEQRACSPSVQAEALNVSLTSLLTVPHELETSNGTEKTICPDQQQSSASEQQQGASAEQDMAPNVTLKEMETAREVEKDQSPDCSSKQTYYCSDHPFTEPFYCQTCCKPICRDCAVHCMNKHVTLELAEFIEIAQRQAEDVLLEAYLGIDVLADDMENMGVSGDCVRPSRDDFLFPSLFLQSDSSL